MHEFAFQIFIDPIQIANAISHFLLAPNHRAVLHPILCLCWTVFFIRPLWAATGLDLLRSGALLWHCAHGFLA